MDRFAAMLVFVKVAETESLSAAARALGLSLSSVSRQLASLEDRLGARLVNRTTRQLVLTDEGRIYCERAKRILGAVEEAEIELSAQARAPSGRLHVSAPTLLGRLQLAPLLPAFLARYPQVAVDLTLIDRDVHLVEEGVDLAIRIGKLDESRLIARKLGHVHLVVCAAPEYLEKRGEPGTPEDLSRHDCLVFAEVPGAAEWQIMTPSGRHTGKV